ncbi:MAG: hypothetical protein AAGD96_05310 [Chloroflexota bacterium]
MTHEKDTHDQNQVLETQDTTPSRFRVLMFALLGYLVVACVGYIFFFGFNDNNQVTVSPVPENLFNAAFPPSAYIIENFSENLIQEQVDLANIQGARDLVEFASILGTYPEIRVVFVDTNVLDNPEVVDTLQREFERGKVIVGLRTSHELLGDVLGQQAILEEVELYDRSNSNIWISAWVQNEDGEPIEISTSYDQFEDMLDEVHELAENHSN